MSELIYINIRMEARPGMREILRQRMLEAVPNVVALGGTSVVTVDEKDDHVFYLHEIMPNQAAIDADMASPIVKAFLADMADFTTHGTNFQTVKSFPA